MDVIAITASFLTIVHVALSSTKSIHQIVSNIHEAPTHVQDLGSAVENLSLILERLAKTRAFTQDRGCHDLEPIRGGD